MPPRFSVLDLAPVREGGTIAEAFRNSVDLARHAERWGFTRYWIAEHHNMPGIASAATSILIEHVAEATKTIRVGSGGVMLPNHAPLVIAEQFGTLEALHPGRIDLGLGRAPGSDELASRALRYDTAEENFPRQVAELLAFLAPAGQGQRLIAFPGENSNVPVWLLGSSTYSAQLAAKMGLPFAFASHFAPALLLEAIEAYRSGFTPSQLSPTALPDGRRADCGGGDRRAGAIPGDVVTTAPGAPDSPPAHLHTAARRLYGRHLERSRKVPCRFPHGDCGGRRARDQSARRLAQILETTGADELIFVSDVYDHTMRLRSFEIAAEAMKALALDTENVA